MNQIVQGPTLDSTTPRHSWPLCTLNKTCQSQVSRRVEELNIKAERQQPTRDTIPTRRVTNILKPRLTNQKTTTINTTTPTK